jgi:hypothetical protein
MRVKNQNQAVSYRQGKLGDFFQMKIRILLSAGHQLPLQVHPHHNKRTPPSSLGTPSPSISS